jgi:hypothetical protein
MDPAVIDGALAWVDFERTIKVNSGGEMCQAHELADNGDRRWKIERTVVIHVPFF